uniref:Thiamine phosphate synthase/TenI domain-containing protein n=1 Tax=Mucochytrium quahogii TaxID=96639 RepID=A0A7S2SP08_9STRA|mmetsp:Transcript_3159/g.4557  ORF Transcript_3159/g.4557 Transcript_3159/m.4557 type:complete len:203 (+) Transcript_3159:1208-1816(+)
MERVFILTSPDAGVPDEAHKISRLAALDGVNVVVRKPGWDEQQVDDLMATILANDDGPALIRNSIIVHRYPGVCKRYRCKGVHLTSNQSVQEAQGVEIVGRSTHSVEEIFEFDGKVAYMFLSPIYNSISKQGYCSNFTPEQLERLFAKHKFQSKIVALGGVKPDNMSSTLEMGFDAVAILGFVWECSDFECIFDSLKDFPSR